MAEPDRLEPFRQISRLVMGAKLRRAADAIRSGAEIPAPTAGEVPPPVSPPAPKVERLVRWLEGRRLRDEFFGLQRPEPLDDLMRREAAGPESGWLDRLRERGADFGGLDAAEVMSRAKALLIHHVLDGADEEAFARDPQLYRELLYRAFVQEALSRANLPRDSDAWKAVRTAAATAVGRSLFARYPDLADLAKPGALAPEEWLHVVEAFPRALHLAEVRAHRGLALPEDYVDREGAFGPPRSREALRRLVEALQRASWPLGWPDEKEIRAQLDVAHRYYTALEAAAGLGVVPRDQVRPKFENPSPTDLQDPFPLAPFLERTGLPIAPALEWALSTPLDPTSPAGRDASRAASVAALRAVFGADEDLLGAIPEDPEGVSAALVAFRTQRRLTGPPEQLRKALERWYESPTTNVPRPPGAPPVTRDELYQRFVGEMGSRLTELSRVQRGVEYGILPPEALDLAKTAPNATAARSVWTSAVNDSRLPASAYGLLLRVAPKRLRDMGGSEAKPLPDETLTGAVLAELGFSVSPESKRARDILRRHAPEQFDQLVGGFREIVEFPLRVRATIRAAKETLQALDGTDREAADRARPVSQVIAARLDRAMAPLLGVFTAAADGLSTAAGQILGVFSAEETADQVAEDLKWVFYSGPGALFLPPEVLKEYGLLRKAGVRPKTIEDLIPTALLDQQFEDRVGVFRFLERPRGIVGSVPGLGLATVLRLGGSVFGVPTHFWSLAAPSASAAETAGRYGLLAFAPKAAKLAKAGLSEALLRSAAVRRRLIMEPLDAVSEMSLLEIVRSTPEYGGQAVRESLLRLVEDRLKTIRTPSRRLAAIRRELAYLQNNPSWRRTVELSFAVDPARTIFALDPSGLHSLDVPNLALILPDSEWRATIGKPAEETAQAGLRGEPWVFDEVLKDGPARQEAVARLGQVATEVAIQKALADGLTATLETERFRLSLLKGMAESTRTRLSQGRKRPVTWERTAKELLKDERFRAGVPEEWTTSAKQLGQRLRRIGETEQETRLRAERIANEIAGLQDLLSTDPLARSGIKPSPSLFGALREYPEVLGEVEKLLPVLAQRLHKIREDLAAKSKAGSRAAPKARKLAELYLESYGSLPAPGGVLGAALVMLERKLAQARLQAGKVVLPYGGPGTPKGERLYVGAIAQAVRKTIEAQVRRRDRLLKRLGQISERYPPEVLAAVKRALAEPGINSVKKVTALESHLRRSYPGALKAADLADLREFLKESTDYQVDLLSQITPDLLTDVNVRELLEHYSPQFFQILPARRPAQAVPTAESPAGIFSVPLEELQKQRGLEGSLHPWRVIYRRHPSGPRRSTWFETAEEARNFADKLSADLAVILNPVELTEQLSRGLSDDGIASYFAAMEGLRDVIGMRRLQQFLADTAVVKSEEAVLAVDPARLSYVQLPESRRLGPISGQYLHRSAIRYLRTAADMSQYFRRLVQGLQDAINETGIQHMIDIIGIERELGGWEKIGRLALSGARAVAMGSWILASPGTWFANVVYNTFLMGVGLHIAPWQMFTKTFLRGVQRLFDVGDPRLRELVQAGLAIDVDALSPLTKAGRAARRFRDEYFGGQNARNLQAKIERVQELEDRAMRLFEAEELGAEELGSVISELHERKTEYQELLRRQHRDFARRAIEWTQKASNVGFWPYSAVDAVMKAGAAEVLAERGMTPREIAHMIGQYMQRYSDVPPYVQALTHKTFGTIIASFPYEMLRISKNLIVHRLPELSLALGAIQTTNLAGLAHDRMTMEDFVAEVGRGNDTLAALNAAFTLHLPGGIDVQLGDLIGLTVLTSPHGIFQNQLDAIARRDTPAATVVAGLGNVLSNFIANQPLVTSVYSMAWNTDAFTGRRITEDRMDIARRFQHVLVQFLPNYLGFLSQDSYWDRQLYSEPFDRVRQSPIPEVSRWLRLIQIVPATRQDAIARVVRNAQAISGDLGGPEFALYRKGREADRAALHVLADFYAGAPSEERLAAVQEYARLGRRLHPASTPGAMLRVLQEKLRTGPTAYVFAKMNFKVQTAALVDMARRGMDAYPEWPQMLAVYLNGDEALLPNEAERTLRAVMGAPVLPEPPDWLGALRSRSTEDISEAIQAIVEAPRREPLEPARRALLYELQRRVAVGK